MTNTLYKYVEDLKDATRWLLHQKRAYEDILSSLKNAVFLDRTIFVGGNGGSAAIADHFACDFLKGVRERNKGDFNPRVVSLSSNGPLLSAIGNDFGYQYTLSYQLKSLARANDVLVLISSSGNSLNIINAINEAKLIGMTIIGLSGFDGGALRKERDFGIHIPSNDYGVVEDTHSIIMHALSYDLKLW